MLGLVFDPPRTLEVTSFLNLVPVYNTGVSFGLFGDAQSSRWLLVGIALAIVVVLLVWLVRAQGTFVRRSEEHTSELQSLMRISYAVFCLKKKKHLTQVKQH